VSVRLSIAALALAVVSCTPTEPPAQPGASTAPLTDVEAARLFQRRCASCHGAQGRGDGPSAPIVAPANLTDPTLQSALTDADIATLLREGRGAMPSFGSLTGPEVDALIRHVRGLVASGSDEGSR